MWHDLHPITEQGYGKLVPVSTHGCIFLSGSDSTASRVQMAREAEHKCCVKGDEFILTFTENVL